jgi:L-glyceraldehyde 3-phosphate reductase
MAYIPAENRYENMQYNLCGNSGLKLPAISLGLWHNFGRVDSFENSCQILRRAFDMGITHFDLANNYGPPPGSAEEIFGRVLKNDFAGFRDEMIIATKSGYDMWPGPYGDGGSRKYLIASLDQSLKRMGLDYVDIFYSHRFDPETPLEETMAALHQTVQSGKALYAGISNYSPEQTLEAVRILKDLGTPCLIHQFKYSLFQRDPEAGLLKVLADEGIGSIAFSPLAQGLLTNRYLNGIPEDSRAAKSHGFLRRDEITEDKIRIIEKLNAIAQKRDQSLAQMSLAWVLKYSKVTSVVVGVSSVEQLESNVRTLENLQFNVDELSEIEDVFKESV